ncbi:hypothetical protein BH11MYX2_BH11MYX2_17490 [soil metagenome]
MQTIDRDILSSVTGGCGCGPQQPPQDPTGGVQTQVSTGAPGATGAPGGTDVMGGLQQLLGFFQSSSFQQLVGGIQGLVGQAGQSGATSTAQPTAQA